jgi:8-oxo-dGTP diphosphatase
MFNNVTKSKQQYVCGFLFSKDKEQVLLMQKNRPEWQKDRLNGVGGKIEHGESEYEAMVRECQEECGLEVNNWNKFFELEGPDFVVHFFRAFADIYEAKSLTDEKIGVYPSQMGWGYKLLPNLRWLIPMALDNNTTGGHAYNI